MFGHGGFGNRYRRRMDLYPAGYAYIGPCRCGFGPDAYYMAQDGRIIHANEIFRKRFLSARTKQDLQAELEWLKEQKAELEKRLQEVEEEIKKENI